MSYVKGDRVRMVNNPAQLGTVTGERDQMFLSFVGVQWQSGDFGFVAPSNLEWVGSNMTPEHIEAIEAIAGMSKADRASLAAAHRMAMEAVTNIVGQSKPSPGGKDLTDWQTRAEGLERELSASGGRNIDLLKRAERAESDRDFHARTSEARKNAAENAQRREGKWRELAKRAEARERAARRLAESWLGGDSEDNYHADSLIMAMNSATLDADQ